MPISNQLRQRLTSVEFWDGVDLDGDNNLFTAFRHNAHDSLRKLGARTLQAYVANDDRYTQVNRSTYTSLLEPVPEVNVATIQNLPYNCLPAGTIARVASMKVVTEGAARIGDDGATYTFWPTLKYYTTYLSDKGAAGWSSTTSERLESARGDTRLQSASMRNKSKLIVGRWAFRDKQHLYTAVHTTLLGVMVPNDAYDEWAAGIAQTPVVTK